LDDVEMAGSGCSGGRGNPVNEEIGEIGQIGLKLYGPGEVVAGNAAGELLEQVRDWEEAMH